MVGELPPLSGRVGFGTNVKVGYYAQGHEGLPIDGSPLSILLASQPMGEEAARTYLARFLFRGEEVLAADLCSFRRREIATGARLSSG